MTATRLPVPTEAQEQAALISACERLTPRIPELALLFHIPNGGHRHKVVAARLQAQGVKAGVPDLCLPVARWGCHGLYIELKRSKGGRVQVAQQQWLNQLDAEGYMALRCCGWTEALRAILDYLGHSPQEFGL